MEQKLSLQSNTIEIEKDSISCIICLEIAFDPIVYDCCSTILCVKCYTKFKKTSNKCPFCRLENAKAKSNILLKKIVSSISIKCPFGCEKLNKYMNIKSHILNSHSEGSLQKDLINKLVDQFNIIIFDQKRFPYHTHPLNKIPNFEGWKCVGKILFGDSSPKCQEGKLDNQFIFNCDECDYNICEVCVEINDVKEFSIGNLHCHSLKYSERDNGWNCDGNKVLDACKYGITSFYQTTGFKRFRCELCDFDFCEKCLLHAMKIK